MTREVLWGAGVCFTPFLRQVATHVWIMLVYFLRVCSAHSNRSSRQHAIAPPCTFDIIGHCALGSSSTRQYLGTRFPSSLRKCGSFFQRCAAADLSVPARPQRAGHVKNDGGGGPEQCSTEYAFRERDCKRIWHLQPCSVVATTDDDPPAGRTCAAANGTSLARGGLAVSFQPCRRCGRTSDAGDAT